jgi:hypothetical protein
MKRRSKVRATAVKKSVKLKRKSVSEDVTLQVLTISVRMVKSLSSIVTKRGARTTSRKLAGACNHDMIDM